MLINSNSVIKRIFAKIYKYTFDKSQKNKVKKNDVIRNLLC